MKLHYQKRQRARELGVPLSGVPGTINAITDVPGVLVGTQTLSSIQDKSLTTGTLPVQTGVTAILPRGFDDWYSLDPRRWLVRWTHHDH